LAGHRVRNGGGDCKDLGGKLYKNKHNSEGTGVDVIINEI